MSETIKINIVIPFFDTSWNFLDLKKYGVASGDLTIDYKDQLTFYDRKHLKDLSNA